MKLTKDIWIDENKVIVAKKSSWNSSPDYSRTDFESILFVFTLGQEDNIAFSNKKARDKAFSKFMKIKDGKIPEKEFIVSKEEAEAVIAKTYMGEE